MTDLRKAAEMALEVMEYNRSKGTPNMGAAIDALRQALAQPEQEPVVWMYQDKSTNEIKFQKHMRVFVDHGATYEVPLYTAPPKREWVGLTEEEVDECYYWKGRQWTTDELVRHVEAKLKDKNT